MLEYRINAQNLSRVRKTLNITSTDYVDFSTISDYSGENVNKVILICDCDNMDGLNVGSKILCSHSIICDFSQLVETTEDSGDDNWLNERAVYAEDLQNFVFNKEYTVMGLNETEGTFSIMFDKYCELDVDSFEIIKNDPESKTVDEIILNFRESHIFDTTDEITLFFRYVNEEGVFEQKEIEGYFVKPMSIGINPNDFEEDELLKKFEFNGVEVFRENYLFSGKDVIEYSFEKPTVSINLPLSNSFETNLYQNENIREYFIEEEKKKAINRTIDIEKDVYYPCVYDKTNKKYSDVFTLKFNLHFREHRGPEWLVNQDSLWNGCKKVGNDVELLFNDDEADLLQFLNFNNEDVHYQKSRLKRSFIRLSYYDSPDPTNQNMLGYATVFFDTGDMFARYMRYYEEEGLTSYENNVKTEEETFYVINYDNNDTSNYGEYEEKIKVSGIRVNKNYEKHEIKKVNDNEVLGDRTGGTYDEKRLAAQFVVKSKNTSLASSDGFYVYIWKDNEYALPQDIYMKVEFNHAGYGRTVPFMMPYYDAKKHNDSKGSHIKSFKEIVNDFIGDSEEDETCDKPYGLRQYVKYSHIHFKYVYDKDEQKHRYYLDPDTYGEQSNKNNEIVLNLYEAKLGVL